jgi:predicted alpha-1,2-mannosidase
MLAAMAGAAPLAGTGRAAAADRPASGRHALAAASGTTIAPGTTGTTTATDTAGTPDTTGTSDTTGTPGTSPIPGVRRVFDRHATGYVPPARCSKDAAGHLVACSISGGPGQAPAIAARPGVVRKPVRNPAAFLDTRTWTSDGGNTFPGADVPFGMVQWSPDTMPNRSDGGGYTYGDGRLTGYSLTHLSGPGCRAAGDVPILPMTGPAPHGNPSTVTTSFTNNGEVAQAGYYSARSNSPATIVSAFTATPHTAMGRFTFPRTPAADFLIKLADSERADVATTAQVLSRYEIAGSVTTGDFCDQPARFGSQLYTVYFDILFNRPFATARIISGPGKSGPNSVFLTYNTTANRVIEAHVAISYVSIANARLDRQTETPGWNFDHVRAQALDAWNALLRRIAVTGGSYPRTQEFYSLLYKDFLQPNIVSDVNGQYLGSDRAVHTVSPGQRNQYGMFSGWDIYHSLAQLQAMLDPQAASDMAQSLVNYYAQNQILPQWGYLNLDGYVMLGDPADAIIADYYAFGATGFDTMTALSDMLRQATTVNRVRPGTALADRYGYLPQNGSYGCCGLHYFVSALLEYDTADFALAQYAAALGDAVDAASLRRQANDWMNVFSPASHLLVPRFASGAFVPGLGPGSNAYYAEGDAQQYLWDVPNDYAGLFTRLGGPAKVVPALRRYLSRPNAGGSYALITNEFDDGEQFALDYAGDPAGTQQAVNTIRSTVYRPGPAGLPNNDDLGAESSQFIWEMLGMYPENPGSGTLVLASPGFSRAVITLPSGRRIAITAPGASATRFYVRSLRLDGRSYSRLYVPFGVLAGGASLTFSLGTRPTAWGSAPGDAPPSYGP